MRRWRNVYSNVSADMPLNYKRKPMSVLLFTFTKGLIWGICFFYISNKNLIIWDESVSVLLFPVHLQNHYTFNDTNITHIYLSKQKLLKIEYIYIFKYIFMKHLKIYRVSQEEGARLRENVPYVKVHRYNPKHLYPKLKGYGDNGQRSLKVWQLLHNYWLPNSY